APLPRLGRLGPGRPSRGGQAARQGRRPAQAGVVLLGPPGTNRLGRVEGAREGVWGIPTLRPRRRSCWKYNCSELRDDPHKVMTRRGGIDRDAPTRRVGAGSEVLEMNAKRRSALTASVACLVLLIVTATVGAATIAGTAGNDTLRGSGKADKLYGKAGN